MPPEEPRVYSVSEDNCPYIEDIRLLTEDEAKARVQEMLDEGHELDAIVVAKVNSQGYFNMVDVVPAGVAFKE